MDSELSKEFEKMSVSEGREKSAIRRMIVDKKDDRRKDDREKSAIRRMIVGVEQA